MHVTPDLYLFVERKTNEVVAAKRSFGIDFCMSCSDFYSYKADASSKISLPTLMSDDLIQRKIKVMLWLRATVHLIRKGIEGEFSDVDIKAMGISDGNSAKVKILLAAEKDILLQKVSEMEARVEKLVSDADSIERVEEGFRDIRLNVRVGTYSPLERERKILSGNF